MANLMVICDMFGVSSSNIRLQALDSTFAIVACIKKSSCICMRLCAILPFAKRVRATGESTVNGPSAFLPVIVAGGIGALTTARRVGGLHGAVRRPLGS
jgi:hypothetical protein